MGEIFANDVTDKGLNSKIHKQLMQLNIQKKTTQSKWANNPIKMSKQTFLQERHTDGQEAPEKMFNITNY